MQYRREIDGLRGIAVLSVILFHAGFSIFSGGFVGVDVFFVISGYLITSIMIGELRSGTFSFLSFYERRARRILPALFLVVLACFPFALNWLSSSDLLDFSRSLSHLMVFASNFHFNRTTGYFDLGADLKPLLHTWSLSVEEQYYLLFPVLFAFLFRFKERFLLISFFVLAALSLIFAEYFLAQRPSTAFFLMPGRLWQLLLGASIAVLMAQGKLAVRRSEFGSSMGLLLVLFSIFCFSANTPSPGLYMFPPTFGAALVIVYATPETLVGRLLGARALVGVGLISYSAYLWHQPLFAFARYRLVTELSDELKIILCLVTLLLSYLSWKFVETPLRSKHRLNRQKFFAGAVALA